MTPRVQEIRDKWVADPESLTRLDVIDLFIAIWMLEAKVDVLSGPARIGHESRPIPTLPDPGRSEKFRRKKS